MGILNIDPESFYKHSIVTTIDQACKKTGQMIDQGMDILDVGGFSSRPGMKIPSYEEERNRVMPILSALHTQFPDLIISLDTMRTDIASEAFDSGVEIINDISAGHFDSRLPNLVAKNNKTYIAMHMKGLPENMMNSENTRYDHLMMDILQYFSERLKLFKDIGLSKVIIDPGFGFGKTLIDNYKILKNLEVFEILDKPILVGLSRKAMIWKTTKTNPDQALIGTLIAEFYAALKGCHMIRVHDVGETREMLTILQTINNDGVN